ncbi:MAG TPA: NAD(P) transhydrogenase subunit alpha [Coriobacteriia bacterium]|nr:NAD(P) transhydrogenase subunit alpha [Coriobacteriia bacterium]
MMQIVLMVVVFAASYVIGYLLISRVPQRLHTPLMSLTNAISAVTILGALLLFVVGASPSPLELALGGLAVLMAAFNMVGGFVVTDRMTRLFKR